MRAAIYTRVSTDEQAKEGLSLEFQERECREYAHRQGFTVVEVYSDPGFSGALESRPDLNRMLSDAHSYRFDVLITWKFDRLYRVAEYQKRARRELAERGIVWRSSTENIDIYTPSGNLQHTIHATFSEWERDIIKERTRAGKIQKAKSGRQPMLNRPYGYRIMTKAEAQNDPALAGRDGEYVFNPAEVEAVRLMYRLCLEGKSLREICRVLDKTLHKPMKSEHWNPVSVRQILTNPVYCGVAYANRIIRNPARNPKTGAVVYRTFMRLEEEWVRIPTPAAVSREEFDLVQALLKENKQKRGGRPERLYPLSGMVKCGGCGRNYGGKTNRNHRFYEKSLRRYPGQEEVCRNRSWKADTLEKGALKLLSLIAENPDVVREALRAYFEEEDRRQDTRDERKRLETELSRIERQLQALIEKELDEPELASIHAGIKSVKKMARKEILAKLESLPDEPEHQPQATLESVGDVCRELSRRLLAVTDEAVMREVFLTLIEGCEIAPDGESVSIRVYSGKLFILSAR